MNIDIVRQEPRVKKIAAVFAFWILSSIAPAMAACGIFACVVGVFNPDLGKSLDAANRAAKDLFPDYKRFDESFGKRFEPKSVEPSSSTPNGGAVGTESQEPSRAPPIYILSDCPYIVDMRMAWLDESGISRIASFKVAKAPIRPIFWRDEEHNAHFPRSLSDVVFIFGQAADEPRLVWMGSPSNGDDKSFVSETGKRLFFRHLKLTRNTEGWTFSISCSEVGRTIPPPPPPNCPPGCTLACPCIPNFGQPSR